MKKSIFNIALLSVLFVLGACSVKDDGDDANAAIDAALGDALDQVGSVEGMEIWSFSVEDDSTAGVLHKLTQNLYLSLEEYKQIIVNQVNGSFNGENFNNEIDSKGAEKGTLDISSDSFELYERNGATEITTGVLKTDYTIVHIQTPVEVKEWTSVKAGGTGNWVVNSSVSLSYYIVKKTDTILSMIEVDLHTLNTPANGYKLKNTTADAIAKATTYTKK